MLLSRWYGGCSELEGSVGIKLRKLWVADGSVVEMGVVLGLSCGTADVMVLDRERVSEE